MLPPAAPKESIINDSYQIHSLKEGENWLVFHNDKNAPKISVIHGPMLSADDVRDEDKMDVDGVEGGSKDTKVSVLCIDVDNTTNCLAVKDVRDQSKAFETNDNQFKLELFLARRKLGVKNSDKRNRTHCHEKNIENEGKSVSSDLSSRGYTSDDENDDLEETDDLKQKQTCDLVPEEKDADGNPLYEPHEILPSRQLRILRDRDRIIMKYTHINSDAPRIAKFEYVYGRRKYANPLANALGLEEIEASITARPRLLSIKSDANLFKPNDKSTAEAPSVDDISIKATVDNHQAGKDWSAVDDKKNASDDDAMEEYSYLTGEVVIRDQASMSAITGDEAMPAVSSRGKPGTSHGPTSPTSKKEKEVSFDRNLSPKETPENKQRSQEGFQLEITEAKEDNNDLSEFLSCRSHEQDTPKRQKEKDHDESSTETELDLLSQPSQTKPMSPKAPKRFEETSHNHSLPVLDERSKNNGDDDDSTTCSETANELPEFRAEASYSYANDDGDDISQTQPLPRHMMEQNSKAGSDDADFSDIEEEGKRDDSPRKLPSQVEVQEAYKSPEIHNIRFSQLTGTPKSEQANIDNDASHEGTKCDDNQSDDEYNAETQFEHEPMIDNSQSTEEAYNAETQFEHILPEAEKVEADDGVVGNSAEPVEEVAKDRSKSEEEFKPTQAVCNMRSKNSEAKCNSIGKDGIPKSQADSQHELLSESVETQFVKLTKSPVDHQPLSEDTKADRGETTAEATNIHDETGIEPGHKSTNIRSKTNRDKICDPPIGIDAAADKHTSESTNDHNIRANSSSPRQQSALDSERLLSNDAIHHVKNGAMMTGSVGGANIDLDLLQGSTRDLLTSIAMQSTNLPEMAMLHNPSEETTVVNGTKQKDHTTKENINQFDKNNNAYKSDSGNINSMKSGGIPTEVFVETPAKSTTSSERLKRSRRSIGDNLQVRVMFTGVDISSKHRKVCILSDFISQHCDN